MTPQDQLARAARFRRLHEGPDIFVMPNPWDAGSARILAALGFKALATTSAGIAFGHGRPDGAGAVTLHDALVNAHAIAEATTLPVSGDLEDLYAADSDEIAVNIAKAAESGLVGASIEDASPNAPDGIHPIGEATERVAAAVAAKDALSFPFTLTARAENFLRGRADLPDTIARLRAFAEAGADVVFAPGLPDLDAVEAVCAAVDVPVSVMAGVPGQNWTVADLHARGVRRISVGPALALAALTAAMRGAREIADSGSFGFTTDSSSFAEISGFMAPPA